MNTSTKKTKKKFTNIFFELSIPLIVGVILAILWANVDGEVFNYNSYLAFIHQDFLPGLTFIGHKITFHFLVNDLFMVFFFGIATVEIVRSFQPGGPLSPIKKSLNPLLATVGGVAGPVGVFFILASLANMDNLLGDVSMPQILNGWGIPTATDIALAWLFARLILGKNHPAISFLLLLAIVDDAIGLIIIAIFYPSPEAPVQPAFLIINLVAMAIAYGLNKRGVKNLGAYLLFAGLPSWLGLLLTHVHPALALVPILPFLPISKEFDLTHRFEERFKQPVDAGLLFFGIANAGVQFAAINQVTWIIFAALFIGKPLGIFGFSFVGKNFFGFPLPEGVNYRTLFVVGMLAGTGLTVALFVAGEAYTNPLLQGPAKMGAIFSIFCVPIALFLTIIFRVKKVN